jgi:hypothetical protein
VQVALVPEPRWVLINAVNDNIYMVRETIPAHRLIIRELSPFEFVAAFYAVFH